MKKILLAFCILLMHCQLKKDIDWTKAEKEIMERERDIIHEIWCRQCGGSTTTAKTNWNCKTCTNANYTFEQSKWKKEK